MKPEINLLTDSELVESARSGSADASDELLNRYKSLVNALARPYFLVGGEFEDLVQEGMVGLSKAINTFKPTELTAFSSYAYACIKSKIFDVIKTANRDRHKPLNNYIPINIYIDMPSPIAEYSPEDAAIRKDNTERLYIAISSELTAAELSLFKAYMAGKTYREIALELDKSSKTIDNMLQKIKRKLRKIYNNFE